MARILLLVAVIGSGFLLSAEAAPYRKPRVPETAAAPIQGLWKQVYVEFEGVEQKAEYATNNHWRITDTKICIMTGPGHANDCGGWIYKLNPETFPIALDLDAGSAKYPAIIQIDGNRITVCLQNFPARGRPSDFISRPGSGIGKFIYQRVP